MKTLNNEVPITKCAEPKDSSVVSCLYWWCQFETFLRYWWKFINRTLINTKSFSHKWIYASDISFTPWTSYVFNSKSVFCNVTNFTAPPKKKKVESDNDWDEEESEEEVKPKSKSRGRPTKIEKPKRWEQIYQHW